MFPPKPPLKDGFLITASFPGGAAGVSVDFVAERIQAFSRRFVDGERKEEVASRPLRSDERARLTTLVESIEPCIPGPLYHGSEASYGDLTFVRDGKSSEANTRDAQGSEINEWAIATLHELLPRQSVASLDE